LIATLLIVLPLLALLILGLMEGFAQVSLLSENVAFVQGRFGEIMGRVVPHTKSNYNGEQPAVSFWELFS
jgi:hypothetical protein